jgi:hypothetical protein
VDTDAKKMERFRDGLKSEFYERLILLEPDSYHELVNKAISQEDAMMKVLKEKKRYNEIASGIGSGKKFRFVKKNAHGSSQSSASGHWRMTPSQHKPSGNFQYRQAQPQVFKPKEFPATTITSSRPHGPTIIEPRVATAGSLREPQVFKLRSVGLYKEETLMRCGHCQVSPAFESTVSPLLFSPSS